MIPLRSNVERSRRPRSCCRPGRPPRDPNGEPRPHVLDPDRLPDHIDPLYRAAWALSRSRNDAEGLVQETFLSVLARPRVLRDDNEIAYLPRALRSTYANRHRTGARRPATRELFEADPPQTLCTHRPGFGATHQTGARPAHRFRSRTRKRRCASLVSWFPNSRLLGSCPGGWRSDSQVTG